MCGIGGYIGNNDTRSIILTGLQQIKYRGYDCVGLAILDETENKKYKEPFAHLRDICNVSYVSNLGIGYTKGPNAQGPSYKIPDFLKKYKNVKIENLFNSRFYSKINKESIANFIEYLFGLREGIYTQRGITGMVECDLTETIARLKKINFISMESLSKNNKVKSLAKDFIIE